MVVLVPIAYRQVLDVFLDQAPVLSEDFLITVSFFHAASHHSVMPFILCSSGQALDWPFDDSPSRGASSGYVKLIPLLM